MSLHLVPIFSFTFVSYSVTKDTLTASVSGTVSQSFIYLLPLTASEMAFATSNPLQGYATAAKLPMLSKVVVVGVPGPVTKATLNGQPISGFAYNASTSTLTLTNFAVTMDTKYTIMWQ